MSGQTIIDTDKKVMQQTNHKKKREGTNDWSNSEFQMRIFNIINTYIESKKGKEKVNIKETEEKSRKRKEFDSSNFRANDNPENQ